MSGIFVISLDFELIWGVRDKRDIDKYGDNIIGARKAIPMILELFKKYKIHCTWATVGLLFCKDKNELISALPDKKPSYDDSRLSAYTYLNEVLENEENDPYHFAYSIIDLINKYDGQEIGSHTFSHYYCEESGQVLSDFENDMNSAVYIAAKRGITLKSFVFPRNQVVSEYLNVLKNLGFICYRGNPDSLLYKIKIPKMFNTIIRGLRFINSYFNIFGHNTYTLDKIKQKPNEIINIPASAFLRPFSHKFRLIEKLKLNRIYKSMLYAAKRNEVYHLWWHPHNFGDNITENINQLEMILRKYAELNKEYSFRSMNLGEIAESVRENVYEKV